MNKLVKVWTVGRMSYGDALKLQQYLVCLHHKNSKMEHNTILLIEHDPVYTIGIRSKNYTIEDVTRLKATGEYKRLMVDPVLLLTVSANNG